MRRTLQLVGLVLALSAVALWAARGANRGWTKTSIKKMTLDEVTGIESPSYEERFVPGVDFLGAVLLGAGVLAGASFLIRKQTKTKT